jgi:coenzyme F420 hydrogenase subunit beta
VRAPKRWPQLPPTLVEFERIFDDDLCHRCGACVGICPTDVLEVDEEQWPFIARLDRFTDCGLCVAVCPGLEFDFGGFYQELFGLPASYEASRGHVRKAFLGYSTDPEIRREGTAGGVVTGLLVSLLESGQIDGALVVGTDERELWKGRARIACSRRELLESSGSKYAVVSLVDLLADLRRRPGRFALVGLPCHIHGFRKLERLAPAWGRKIALAIGLYCHATLEHEVLRRIFAAAEKKTGPLRSFRYRAGKLAGSWRGTLGGGEAVSLPYPRARGFHPNHKETVNVLYKLYAPGRCLTCIDGAAEFADLAVADAWLHRHEEIPRLQEGFSLVVARSPRGESALEYCAAAGAIRLEPLRREEVERGHEKMIRHKRERAFLLIERHRRQGRTVPRYGIEPPRPSWRTALSSRLNVASYSLSRSPRLRALALALLLSPLGRFALWLNRIRRSRLRTITPEV